LATDNHSRHEVFAEEPERLGRGIIQFDNGGDRVPERRSNAPILARADLVSRRLRASLSMGRPPPQPSPAQSAGEGAGSSELLQQAVDVIEFGLRTSAFGVAATEFFLDGAGVLAFALFGNCHVAALVGAGTALAEPAAKRIAA
jgi:hypothetical protein